MKSSKSALEKWLNVLKEEIIWTHPLLFRFLSDLNFDGVYCSQPTWAQFNPCCAMASSKGRNKTPPDKGRWRPDEEAPVLVAESSWVGQEHPGTEWNKMQRKKDSGWKPAQGLFRVAEKFFFFQSFPETYWSKNLCAIKFPLIFKFHYADILPFHTKSVFSLSSSQLSKIDICEVLFLLKDLVTPCPGWSSVGWKGYFPQLSNSFPPPPPWETLAHFQIPHCKQLSWWLPNLIQSNPSGSVKPKSKAPTQARELSTPAPSTALTPPSYQRSPAPQSSHFNWQVWGF